MATDAALSEYLAMFEAEQQRKPDAGERAELRARLDAGRPPLDSLRLLTVAEYAERERITTQATYKRINQKKIHGVTISAGEKKGRCVIVSATDAEQATAQAGGSSVRTGEQAAPIGAVERAELEKLREENKRLQAQLDEERAAARAQSDRIMSLAERLADLTAASQVLLQQQKAGVLAAYNVDYEATEDTREQTAPPEAEAQNAAAESSQVAPEITGSTKTAAGTPPIQQQTEKPKKGFFARLFGV